MQEGYKQTEIGIIPKDWDCIAAKHLMKIETGSRNTEHKTDMGKYPFFVRSQKVEHIDTYHYDCEAVLTAGDGVGTGKVFHHYIGKFDAHQRVYVMSNFDGITGRYFYNYFSENFGNEVSKYTAKSSVDSVRRDMIAEMLIPTPTIPEQERIAEALSNVDSMISSLEKLIAKKKSVKQGAMQELLTGKKRLPGFTGEWAHMELGKYGSLMKETINPQLYSSEYFWEYSMPAFDEGRTPIKQKGADMHSNRTVICGKVLLFNKLNVRQKRIWLIDQCRDSAVCSSEFLPYKSDAINLELLSQILYTDKVTLEFIGMSTGTSNSQKRITPDAFLEYKVYLPVNEKEQAAIANVFSCMDNEIEALDQKLAKTRQIKQGMMQQLLTGKIRLV